MGLDLSKFNFSCMHKARRFKTDGLVMIYPGDGCDTNGQDALTSSALGYRPPAPLTIAPKPVLIDESQA
jgi:hypothetical protein